MNLITSKMYHLTIYFLESGNIIDKKNQSFATVKIFKDFECFSLSNCDFCL